MRLLAPDDPHRGALGARRQPPGPRVHRRPEGRGWVALLHQLGFSEIHPSRRSRGRGLRRIQEAVHDGEGSAGMSDHEKAILAGGCFWGMQDLIRKQPGVVSTRVGYSGGDVKNATYRNHGTHAEAIEVIFDPDATSYRDVLEFFFQIHDPSTRYRQGNDVGAS